MPYNRSLSFGQRLNCTSAKHRAVSAGMALHDYLLERDPPVRSMLYHCTLDGWTTEVSSAIWEFLENPSAALACYYCSICCCNVI